MSINPTKKGTDRGPSAEVCCDICGHTELVRADYEKTHSGFRVNEGQVIQKVTHNNWSWIKSVLRCPTCEEARRAEAAITKARKESAMAQKVDNVVVITPVADEPRQPTREQKRLIMAMLEDTYDDKAGRYKGAETDKTVAEAIDKSIMPGWVAQIREEFFGPDNGNEELEALGTDIEALAGKIDQLTSMLNNTEMVLKEKRSELAICRTAQVELTRRLDALKAAVGPRARNV